MPDSFRRRERGASSSSGRTPGHERAARPSSLPERRDPLPRTVDALPILEPSFWAVVDDGVRAMAIELPIAVRAAVDAHVRLLIAWNASINLTALREADQIARAHVLDSLTAVDLCRQLLAGSRRGAGGARLLDLGSGGGYPGLPLAVALGVGRCALVDSVRKKASFLAAAAGAATEALESLGEKGPSFEVLAERAEDLAQEPDRRAGYDLVVARAVGSLAEVAELSLPLVKLGGHVVAWKRRTVATPADELGATALTDEVRAARRVIQAAGGTPPQIVPVPAASELCLDGHVLVSVRKARATPDRYPRTPAERRRAALLT